jgi:hypothetical protein
MGINYNPRIVTNGLVLYFDAANPKSYPGSGTTWSNLCSSYDGTLAGTPTYNGGTPETNFTFNGSSQYVTTNYVQTAVTSYTIAAWIKTSTTSLCSIVNDRGLTFSGGTWGLSITLGLGWTADSEPPGSVFIALDSDGLFTGVASSNAINNNSWCYVTGTFNRASGNVVPADFKLYVNGIIQSTISIVNGSDTAVPLTGLNGTDIARHIGWNSFFPGSISIIQIYTRALNATEISQNFNAHRRRYGI